MESTDPSKRLGSATGRVCYFTVKAEEGLPGGGWGGPWGPKSIAGRENNL